MKLNSPQCIREIAVNVLADIEYLLFTTITKWKEINFMHA